MGIVISSFIIFFILNKYKLVINFGMHPVFSTVLIISIYVYFIYWFSKQYSKEDNKKQNKIILNCCIFINEYLPSIFFATGLLFSIIGLNEMLINAKLSAIIDGLSIIAFGVSLIGMGGSVQQTRKNTNENNECKQKIDDMISSNNNVFDEIKNLNKKMNHMSSRINSINNEIKEKNSIFDFIIRIIKKNVFKVIKKQINKKKFIFFIKKFDGGN